ncbi:hypothetical protein JVU11DRAFT_2753 [Chiua virens]|nr:hypothetical protein JVU11DRAFT_2753 [Chiua virens]
MAPKPHRAGATALPRTHSRSSSSSSSKPALNLHFTQKDPVPSKLQERARKSGYGRESHSRDTSPLPWVNSTARVASKEHIHAHRYAPPPAQRQQGGKTKAGFTLASPLADDDDDEWVSSESGVVTPNNIDSDSGHQTPVDQRKPIPTGPPADEFSPRPDTPRAQPQSLSRVPTIRASRDARQVISVSCTCTCKLCKLRPRHRLIMPTQLPTHSISSLINALSEHCSANTSPIQRTHHKRLSMTRPPSTHSTTSKSEVPLRPHPLIRGQSFGQGTPMTPKVVPLAPLTITSEASPVSSSPGRDQTEKLSSSPSSVRTACAQSSPYRRTSVSSVRSVSTLPSQKQIQSHLLGRTHDRHRTLSSISATVFLVYPGTIFPRIPSVDSPIDSAVQR